MGHMEAAVRAARLITTREAYDRAVKVLQEEGQPPVAWSGETRDAPARDVPTG
jgi:hypothetical protein